MPIICNIGVTCNHETNVNEQFQIGTKANKFEINKKHNNLFSIHKYGKFLYKLADNVKVQVVNLPPAYNINYYTLNITIYYGVIFITRWNAWLTITVHD